MFKVYLLISLAAFVFCSQEENAIKGGKVDDTLHDIVDSYSSVFHHQNSGCSCKQNFCECCEDKVGNVCISVGYFEVFDIPAAFGINITNNKTLFLSVKVNVTNLPCIKLPYVDTRFAVCLQLHNFNITAEYVKVMFDLKVKLMLTSLDVHLGCLLVPRLHPHVNTSTTVQYHKLLKQMGVNKALDDLTGLKFCSSPNSALSIAPQNILLLCLAILMFKMFKQ